MKSMKQLVREYNLMKQDEDFEEKYEFRCCFECYHFAVFMGYDYPICELSGKGVKNPFAYTDCDERRVIHIGQGAYSVCERWKEGGDD